MNIPNEQRGYARECHFPSGYVGSYPHVAVDNVLLRGQNVLLVKRSDSEIEGNKWALPGGYVEMGQSVPDVVIDETAQEAGWRIGELRLFMILDGVRQNDPNHNVSFVFTSTAVEELPDDQRPKPDGEIKDIAWFDLHHLPPEDDMAFDHGVVLGHYREYQRWPHPLPLFLSQASPL